MIWEIITPVLQALLGILIPVGIAALFQWLKKLGLDVEARHRDALQSALTNAAMLALARAGGRSAPATQVAVDYVKRNVPDAVRKFGLDDGRIAELVAPKLEAAVRSGLR